MATNIGSNNGTSFNTINMKPESDEQVDSLYGQNVGDDLAFLYWGVERKAFDLSVQNPRAENAIVGVDKEAIGTSYWRKLPTQDTLHGTYAFSMAGGGASGTLYFDGTLFATEGATVEAGFTWDQSHLDDGEVFAASVRTVHVGDLAAYANLDGLSAWSGTFLML